MISHLYCRVSNHEKRMEKRMDGVRTRAVCVSGINPCLWVSPHQLVVSPPVGSPQSALSTALNVMNDSDC